VSLVTPRPGAMRAEGETVLESKTVDAGGSVMSSSATA
jgi:hypothetical protein